jgi:four helix bundle protein
MATVERFEDLDVWKRARGLTNCIYSLPDIREFARDFGLRDQMRRAAVSIMSDIAEGFESRTQAIFIDYLGRAKGSAGVLRSQLYIALDRKYIDELAFQNAMDQTEVCSKQLTRFIQYLETKPNAHRIKEDQVKYDV